MYSLNSLKGGYLGEYMGSSFGVIKEDTRSLDYGSDGHKFQRPCFKIGVCSMTLRISCEHDRVALGVIIVQSRDFYVDSRAQSGYP